jgi:hypothetical protein
MATAMTTSYSAKIVQASGLVADTRLLLAAWNPAQSVPQNVQHVMNENVLAKISRARLKKELAAFKQRYLQDAEVAAALAELVQRDVPGELLHPILYFLTMQADPLLGDCVVGLLAPRLAAGQRDISTAIVAAWLLEAVQAGKTVGLWSPSTVERVAHGLLATLRDFDIITGKAKKRLHRPYVATPAFAFIAFLLHRAGISGERLVTDGTWARFLLSRRDVEAHFVAADQEGLLHYHAAGRIVRVEFPTTSLMEYARVLAARTL